jgi:hypothetical protein
MTTVNELHLKAMDLADEAFQLRRSGEQASATLFFLKALELERAAALLLPPNEEAEPSRSILYRSAASLAYNGEDYTTAERLVAQGLSGFPPIEIKEELKNLYEDINFKRHLQAHGIVLSDNQWVMTIHGNATSFGGTLVEPLMDRVERVTALFYRTVERLLGIDYRTTGGTAREIKEAYGLYVKAFAPSSFAVSFQIGAPKQQISLFEDQEPRKPVEADLVVDELMKCLEIWESEKTEILKERIGNDTYYQNFVGIAKQIAPDGDAVKLVGFKAIRRGEEKPVTLRKNRKQLREPARLSTLSDRAPLTTHLRGVLRFATSPQSKKYGTVHLTDAEGMHIVRVPIAIMKDVVQPYYEERVEITAVRKGRHLYLEEIGPDN